jgi:hypothetical protein
MIVLFYEARAFFGLEVLVSETDTTPTLMITLNYVIFSNYYRCQHVSVRIVSRVHVRAS